MVRKCRLQRESLRWTKCDKNFEWRNYFRGSARIVHMKEMLYEVRCLKSNEDMILALAGNCPVSARIISSFEEWFRHDITNSELWSSLCNFNTGSVRRVRFLFSYFKISRSFEVCLTSDLGFLFLTLCDGRKCLGTRLSCFCCCCCCFRDIEKQTKHTGIRRSCYDILTFLLYFCGFGGILRGAFWLDS